MKVHADAGCRPTWRGIILDLAIVFVLAVPCILGLIAVHDANAERQPKPCTEAAE